MNEATYPDPQHNHGAEQAAPKTGGVLGWILRNPLVVLILCIPLVLILVTIWAMGWLVTSFFAGSYVVPGGISVNTMAWNHDAKQLAVSFSDGTLEVLDWESGNPVTVHSVPWYEKMSRLQWSQDGNWIAGISSTGLPRPVTLSLATSNGYEPFGRAGEPEGQSKVFAWTRLPGAPASTLLPPELAVAGMSDLFIQKANESVAAVDWRFPKYERTMPGIDGPGSRGLPHQVSCMRVIPDPASPGTALARIVTMREEESITVLDRPVRPNTGADRITKVFHKPIPVYGRFDVMMSPDGGTLAVLGYDQGELMHADLYSVASGGKLQTLQLPMEKGNGLDLEIIWRDGGQSMHQMAWSQDGKRIAGAFRLNNHMKEFAGVLLAWWDVQTGALIATKWAWVLDPEQRVPWDRARGIFTSFGEISWSPTLDKVAMVRPLSVSSSNGKLSWDRQLITLVPAPPEVTGIPSPASTNGAGAR